MMMVFPVVLLATSVIFDIIYLVTGNRRGTETAYRMIIAGIIGGLIAAIFA